MRLSFKSKELAPVLREPVRTEIPQLQDAEISAVYYGQRLAGDFYDFVRTGQNRVLFGLLDVAGQHDDNRDVVTTAQRTFRSSGAELFATDEVNEADAMIELGVRINRAIMKVEGGVRACPAFAGSFHESLGTLCYFNAGHTPGLVRDSTGIWELPATGLPLGLFSMMSADAPTIGLEPGSTLLLVSRGVVESKYKNEEFGFARVKEILQNATSESARQICASVVQSVQQFMRTPPTHDDVTVLALSRAAKAGAIGQT